MLQTLIDQDQHPTDEFGLRVIHSYAHTHFGLSRIKDEPKCYGYFYNQRLHIETSLLPFSTLGKTSTYPKWLSAQRKLLRLLVLHKFQ
jgi:hypothetical protein